MAKAKLPSLGMVQNGKGWWITAAFEGIIPQSMEEGPEVARDLAT